MFATYLSYTDSTWMQSQERSHKRRIELADPYFLPYSRLRPRVQIELQLRILTLPFTVKEGDLIV